MLISDAEADAVPVVVDESTISVTFVSTSFTADTPDHLLKQQPEIPDLNIIISEHFLRPIPPLLRKPLTLYLARLFLIKIANALYVFLPLQAQRYIMHPRLQPLIMPLPENGKLVNQALAQ